VIVPNFWGRSLLSLVSLVVIVGCNKGEESAETDVPVIPFPSTPKYPTEIAGKWEKKDKSTKIDFQADGKCSLESKIMSYSGSGPGGKTVAGGGTRSTSGKWGVENDQIFMQIADQPVIKYRFEVKGESMDFYTGKIKDSYFRLK
jgi:hypothetical protein